MTGPVLHGRRRSSTAYRVGIALALKALRYRSVSHDLRTRAQPDALTFADWYIAPRLFSVGRFAADLSAFPGTFTASERAHIHPAFVVGHLSNLPSGDAP